MEHYRGCLEKHVSEADVTLVQMPLPIYERELTAQERRMHTAYWNRLSALVPDSYFSPDRPILNFMEIGMGLPTLSAQIKASGFTVRLLDLMGFSGPDPDFAGIQRITRHAGPSPIYLLSPMTCGYAIFRKLVRTIKVTYPDAVLVAGGPHVSKLPRQTLEDIPELDIATSDSRFSAGDLVTAVCRGTSLADVSGVFYRSGGSILGSNPQSPMSTPMPNSAAMDLDILPSRYADSSWARVYTALGCAYDCAFCADVLHKRRPPMALDIATVMAQVDSLIDRFSVSLFYIGDETFTYRRDHARTFALAMGQRKSAYWIAQTRADCVDAETLKTRQLPYHPESDFNVRNCAGVSRECRTEALNSSDRTSALVRRLSDVRKRQMQRLRPSGCTATTTAQR